jgi:hypothetical protein
MLIDVFCILFPKANAKFAKSVFRFVERNRTVISEPDMSAFANRVSLNFCIGEESLDRDEQRFAIHLKKHINLFCIFQI